MPEPLHALLVEDSEDDALLVLRALRQGGFDLTWERVETAVGLQTALTNPSWDIIISDYRLPTLDAPAALRIVQQSQLDLPFIVVSGTIGELAAVEMMKAGAHDYLMKGNLIRLPEAVRREVREAQIRAERQQAEMALAKRDRYLSALVEVQRQLLAAPVNVALYDTILAQLGTAAQADRAYIFINHTAAAGEVLTSQVAEWCAPGIPSELGNPTLQAIPIATIMPDWFRQLAQGCPVHETIAKLPESDQLFFTVQGIQTILIIPITVNGQFWGMIGFDHCVTQRQWTELEIGLLSSAAGAIAIAKEREQAIQALEQLNHELEDRVQQRTAALQRSEAHLREAQEVAHLGRWEFDVATERMTWSSEVYRIFALDPATPPPQRADWPRFFPPADCDRLATFIDQAIQAGEPYATDLQIKRADGSSGDIFIKAQLSQDTTGQVHRLFGIVMDISDRKAIEAALQRSEERARATLVALPDLVFRVNHQGEYLDFLASETVSNVDANNVIGQHLSQVLPPAIAQRQLQALEQVLTSHSVYSYEQQVTIEGNTQYEEVRVAPCGNDEVVFFVRNISDRKRAEAQLQQTNMELARATRLKDEFLASMSHELRTPLTSILGLSEVLQEQVFGELNEKQLQYVEIVLQSGHHLLSLINDILDLAKIESGKLELQISPTLLPVLCSSSLNFVKQLAHQKNISLSTHLPADVQEIQVDELRIRQALINLLSNAVKFTPPGGQVTLAAVVDPATAHLQFKVSDTGIGIAPEDMPKLFQSFVQIDSNLNRQYNGTGLGLALVKQIVTLHQGTVQVQSTVGQGSCFTITLPNALHTSPVEPSLYGGRLSPGTTPTTNHQAALLLLADDHPATVETYMAYLTMAGYQVVVATQGQEAIEFAHRYQPDLILMDVQMPGMDGLEAMRHIRATPSLAQTPIIALTALAMSGDREQCLAAGANEYLAKPVNLKHLVATIQDLLRHTSTPVNTAR